MRCKFLQLLSIIVIFPFLAQSQTVIINGIPRDTSYTIYSAYKKIKKKYPTVSFIDEKLPKGVTKKEHITYKTLHQKFNSKRELKLSVFNPKHKRNSSAVLLIHGGGWNSGSPEMLTVFAQNLAANGFVVVIAEYRLTPEAIYPAAVEDLNDAVNWMFLHARKYKFDKNKIAVAGFSAGAQLASLIGTKNTQKRIKAVVNVDGITTFLEKTTIDRAEKAKKEGAKMPVDALWLGGVYSEKPQLWKEASALYWVNENSAPTLFINSSIPRFHNGRDEFIQQLNPLRIYSDVYTFEDSPHSFWLFSPWQNKTICLITDFLNKEIK